MGNGITSPPVKDQTAENLNREEQAFKVRAVRLCGKKKEEKKKTKRTLRS